MATFKDYLSALEKGAAKLAKDQLGGFEADAIEDMRSFLEKTKADLRRWTALLSTRKLTERDFGDLLKAREALAELHALTRSGLALVKLDEFRTGLINLVIDTAVKVYL